MTVHVDLPEGLAQARLVLDDVDNVRAALDALEVTLPGLKAMLCDVDGNVRRSLRIFADGADIRFLDNLETPLGDGTSLRIAQSSEHWR